ncbi:SMI1/KNR4 family protein [Nocardiopsis sp. NRRL B-16309]|uniref:SMI1/KNR4 family protein n=1 Tax=Nocardiopsis sp. NRRL B-16309 TaxID=1519494 RepID=UPI0006ADCF58|nr:SMI1/KNR4 family protein [Nocardiopsis sp. NRRL B-16309]KOX22049.1 cell wall assembly protein [Nocardiopsis sp. NRRL B-16309]
MPENAPALVFLTERQRAGTGEWLPDHRLVVRFEPGGSVPLAQLGWRDLDGAEAVAGFDPDMTTFTGVRITPRGTPHAWRGVLAERPPDSTGHWFRVQGGEGEPEDLRLLVEDGGAPVARLTWADREGGGGTVVLRTRDLDEVASAGEVTDRVRDVRAGDEHTGASGAALNLLDGTSATWLSRRGADRLDFTLTEPVHLRHYVLVSAHGPADRDPCAWELRGSVDGHAWVTLDTRSDESFPGRHLARDFHVSRGSEADTPYRHLRLEITRNSGGSGLQLGRVRFFSADRAYESFTGHRYATGGAPTPYAGIVGGLVAGAPRSVGDWRSFLAGFSADMLRVEDEDELHTVSEEQRSASWLGYDGATEDRITALEHRLGRTLPPSYRSFLAASDGWSTMGTFMYSLRGTSTVGWLADLEDVALPVEYLGEDLVGPALLVSDEGDAQYWLLDAGDVSPDGEWAAYVWASWYPGLGERHRSFADVVVDERVSFEELCGSEGRPVRPEGAEELLAAGRRAALDGRVGDALDAFLRAQEKGSGAAAYLRVVLSAFLDARATHHELRGLLHRPHVVAEIGTEQVRSEAVPLFLRAAGRNGAGDADHAIRLLAEIVPGLDLPVTAADSGAWIAAHRAPEPPAFERALVAARDLAARGATDEAWAVIKRALPEWYPLSPHRIAPVVLLTDPALHEVVTPRRARKAVFTPRGEQPDAED